VLADIQPTYADVFEREAGHIICERLCDFGRPDGKFMLVTVFYLDVKSVFIEITEAVN